MTTKHMKTSKKREVQNEVNVKFKIKGIQKEGIPASSMICQAYVKLKKAKEW